MINAVGREIPEEILKITGKEGYQGAKAKDNCEFTRGAARIRAMVDCHHGGGKWSGRAEASDRGYGSGNFGYYDAGNVRASDL